VVGRTLLSAGLLDLGGLAVTDEPVVGLELLHRLGAVVDEGEASGLATTVLGAETEDGDLVLVGLVELGELGAELILGDVGTVGVEDVAVCPLDLHLYILHRDRRPALTQPSGGGRGGGCG
jgi:hypothetical protein